MRLRKDLIAQKLGLATATRELLCPYCGLGGGSYDDARDDSSTEYRLLMICLQCEKRWWNVLDDEQYQLVAVRGPDAHP